MKERKSQARQKNTPALLPGQKQPKKLSKSTKVAIVYDRINKWGGAERVLQVVHEIFPQAPLYTSIYDKKSTRWANDFQIKSSFLQRLPISKKSNEILAPFMPLAFESFSFEKYDLVISITSEAAKGVITSLKTKHICMCLTPTRYLYSGRKEYFSNPLLRIISKPIIYYLLHWDKMAASRPDAYISISKTVKRRIKTTYNRNSTLIYPPIARIFFNKNTQNLGILPKKKTYFLVVSRLVGYKRVDLAIKAANKLKVPLIIIGEGRKRSSLESIAGPTVVFEGHVSDERLVRRYSQAKALLFPGNEDLGLTMIEAQSCGTPIIAYKKGGATELVKEGVTGEFFNDQTVESLMTVMEKFDPDKYNRKNCIKNAQKFSFVNFKSKLISLINKEL